MEQLSLSKPELSYKLYLMLMLTKYIIIVVLGIVYNALCV